jgi:hypothetical protein
VRTKTVKRKSNQSLVFILLAQIYERADSGSIAKPTFRLPSTSSHSPALQSQRNLDSSSPTRLNRSCK